MPGLVLPTAFLGLNCRARGLHGSFSQSEGAPRTLRLISDSSEEKVSQTTSTRILSDDDDQGATVLSGVRRGSDPLWSRSRSEMADSSAGGAAGSETGKAPVAQRIDPARDKLSPAQLHFMRSSRC
ncbi:uncharacterized protein LOC127560097 isoform X3 [Antechinus flavipes]|uniref:uncharacterized protein LOC127560097 isoform X3 n=1 Tax=Antechinus flavipes TaxID=38775 RepID=UPI002235C72D|nr:uncharacterized protein LOC127560097 isoform X3 [Antechinus flavipes]